MVKKTTVESKHGLEMSYFRSLKIQPVGVIYGVQLVFFEN
jgi:hypothetical protein